MPITPSPGRWPALLAVIPLAGSLSLATAKPSRPTTVRVAIGAPAGALSFRDTTGKLYDLAELRDSKAVLFLFLSTQCPVSNGYAGRFREMVREYTPRGVAIFGVSSNHGESLATVARYARDRSLGFPMVKDPDGALAKRLGATVTPEAVLLDGRGIVRYRGRVDDQRDPGKVKSQDLRTALDAVLAGQAVAQAETKPFGCSIQATARVAAARPTVTFTRDVAPILQEHCQGCHRSGEIGPFPLVSYQDASAWAELIRDYTGRRAMPPWKPVDGHGEFRDVRRLTDAQIRTIARWVEEGTPKGDPKHLPPPRKFTEGWMLGTPDLVLDAGESYELGPEGPDVYRNFVLPHVSDKDQWLKSIEMRPDRRAVVHHVLVYADPMHKSLALDAADPGPGYTSSGGGVGFFPAVPLAGWAPGNTPRFSPPGMALKIPAGARLVLQVHYHPNGYSQRDRTRIGLYFAKEPIRKQIRPLWAVNPFLSIPPGAERHEIRASTRTPANVTAYGVIPHMHLLGREIKVTATLPDGTIKPLVWIKDWDFNWQETYAFKEPIKLPKDTRIDVVAYYDNSTKNPHNPSNPPRTVTWGEATTDEMCIAALGVTRDDEDLIASGAGSQLTQSGK